MYIVPLPNRACPEVNIHLNTRIRYVVLVGSFVARKNVRKRASPSLGAP